MKQNYHKGQSTLELLVTVGIVLAFSVPVIFLLFSITSAGYEDTSKAQADASSRTLADTMNLVYAQGPGAQKEILLNVPANTEAVSISTGEVVVRIRISTGVFEAATPMVAKVVGSGQVIEKKSGLFKLIVRNNNGEVELVEPTQ